MSRLRGRLRPVGLVEEPALALHPDLVVWERQAIAAGEHLVKGQAVSVSGRFEPREYVTSSGDQRVALDRCGARLARGSRS